MINRKRITIKESLSSARKKYLETDNLPKDVFDDLVTIDKTRTKKYLEWLCHQYVTGFTNLDSLESILTLFSKAIKTKYELPSKDIYAYDTLNEIEEALAGFTNYLESRRKEKKKEGAEKLFENSLCKVYFIKTKKACMLYGSHTKWCITSESRDYWESYSSYNLFIFLLDTSDDEIKYAFAIDFIKSNPPDNFKITCFNAPDNEVDWVNVVNEYFDDKKTFLELVNKVFNSVDIKKLKKERIYKKYGISVNDDGTLTCNKSFSITDNNEDEFMNLEEGKLKVKFKEAKSDFIFDLDDTALTSLEGCPEVVGGNFDCSYNPNLTSLKGGPKKVEGSCYYVFLNGLTNLEGAPEEVGVNFECVDCLNLVSLEGGPTVVGGMFRCTECRLSTLHGAPKKVGGPFFCEKMPSLKSLEGAPEEVEVFRCDNIGITNLIGAPKKIKYHNNTTFSFSCINTMSLTSLEGAPETITGGLLISTTFIKNLDYFPKYINGNVKFIKCNRLSELNLTDQTITGDFIIENCKRITPEKVEEAEADYQGNAPFSIELVD